MVTTAYELWDTDSGNLMASFATEIEARACLDAYPNPEGIALVAVNDSDQEGDFVLLGVTR